MNCQLDAASPAQTLPDGIVCRKCGAAEFRTYWQTFANGNRHVRADCARCGAFVRYLKQEGAPEPKFEPKRPDASAAATAAPADDAEWVGWIRPADGRWRPVALAATLGKCWDVLLTCPLDGDRLALPCNPQESRESLPSSWTGWFRAQGSKEWVRRSAGPTYDTAWESLLARVGTSGDLMVTPSTREPGKRVSR